MGNLLNSVGDFVTGIGNTYASILQAQNGGQNASNQPTAAQTAAQKTNIILYVVIGIGVLVAGAIGFMLLRGKGK